MAKIGCDVICKSHSARSNRDPYRLCPTKLSKQELENLYFALLENNLELKKTVNGQQDRIKILSTKVQRMTSAQNVLRSEAKRECCFATKAVINQQKDMITELKRSNERMADRIRKLNMRLCSAKQFCKSATPRCLRCSTATSPYLIKNTSHSFKQHSQSSLKLALSCHNLTRETMVSTYVQTDFWETLKHKLEKKTSCEDNKCRTALDELKQKIVNLNEKISCPQESVSSRVTTLEKELQKAREDILRVRSERVSAEHELQRRENKITQLVTSVRAADKLAAELKTELSIEKRKVAELETRLKAATISNRVTKSIEDTLTSIQESNRSPTVDVTVTCACSPSHKAELNIQQPSVGLLSPKQDHYLDDTKLSKSTDDSGFMDKSHTLLDDQSLNKVIEDLSKRIVVLQAQVDYLTISPPETETVIKETQTLVITEDQNTQTELQFIQPSIQSPLETRKQHPENACNHSKKVLQRNTNITDKDQTLDHEMSINIPKSESTPNWKDSVTKLNLITKISKQNHCKSKRDERFRETLNDNIEISGECNESSSSDEKTYTVNVNNKTDNDCDTNVFDKDKNDFEKDKNVYGKDKIINKKIKTKTNGVDKDEIFQDDIEQKPKEKMFFGNKMLHLLKVAEQKTKVPRNKRLTRTKTQVAEVSTSEKVTYSGEGEGEGSSRPDSPDDTDYEISSMTDISDERERNPPTKNVLSPGEKYANLPSDSCTSPTTNYSFSEGEIPITTARRKSSGENPSYGQAPTPKMEETLQAITDELARCKRLLFSTRSQDTPMT